jgi:hypothetical protein
MRTREQKIKDVLEVKKEIRLIKAQGNPFLDALLKASHLEEDVEFAEKIYLADQ